MTGAIAGGGEASPGGAAAPSTVVTAAAATAAATAPAFAPFAAGGLPTHAQRAGRAGRGVGLRRRLVVPVGAPGTPGATYAYVTAAPAVAAAAALRPAGPPD